MPSSMPDPGNTIINKTDKFFALMKFALKIQL